MAMALRWTAQLLRSASEVRFEVKSLQKAEAMRILLGSAPATRLSSRSSFQRKRLTVAFSRLAPRGTKWWLRNLLPGKEIEYQQWYHMPAARQ